MKDCKIFLFLAVWIGLIYSTSFSHPFINDDVWVVQNNPQIRDWHNIGSQFDKSWPLSEHAYRPLVLISLTLDYALWGLQPFGYRVTSYLWCVLLAFLVWKLLTALNFSNSIAFFATFLYATHPAPLETFHHVSMRGDTMCAVFCLLTFLCYQKNQLGFYLLSLFFFVCALATKEIGIATVLLLCLYEVTIGQNRHAPGKWLRLTSYFLTTALYLEWKLYLFGTISLDTQNALYGVDWLARCYTMSFAFVTYIRVAVLPIHLGADYQLNDFPLLNSWVDGRTWLGMLVVLGYIACWLWYFRKDKTVAFWLGWFGVFLLPVSNIVLPAPIILGERYLVLPLVAFCLASSAGIHTWIEPWQNNRLLSSRPNRLVASRLVLYLVFFICAIGYSLAHLHYAQFWANESLLWQRTLSISPNSYIGHMRLAAILYKEGKIEEALRYWQAATDKKCYLQNAPLAPFNCGKVHNRLNHKEEAIRYLEIARGRIAMFQLPAQKFLDCYYTLGRLYYDKQEWQKAQECLSVTVAHLMAATNLQSGEIKMLAESAHFLALSYCQTNQYDLAITQYQTLLSVVPNYGLAHHNLAMIYLQYKKDLQAAAFHREAAEKLGIVKK